MPFMRTLGGAAALCGLFVVIGLAITQASAVAQAPPNPTAAQARSESSVAQAASSSVEADANLERAHGKPVAAFAIDYDIEGKPAIGAPLELRVSLRPQSSIEDISVQLSTDANLYIEPQEMLLNAASATRSAPAEWVVTVVPVSVGRSYVKLYAEGLLDGSRQGRSLMVPIDVLGSVPEASSLKGTSSLKSANGQPDAVEDSDGEALILLPADERG